MHAFSYPATFRRDAKGRAVVGFLDLPEAHTDGRNMAEAVEEAVDCLGSVLAFRIAEKSDIPASSRLKRGQRLVPVPLWIAGKLALYLTMIEQGVSNSEIAAYRGAGDGRAPDARPGHDTRSEKIQAALEALGKRIVVAIDDAA